MDRLITELSQLTDNCPTRSLRIRIASYTVTREDIQFRLADVIRLTNAIGGPRVAFDPERGCFGLFADRNYEGSSRPVTFYGGIKQHNVTDGDYAAKLGKSGSFFINGSFGFKIEEKGRWINESDSQRSCVNVELGRTVRTTALIRAGDQLFADYGPEYKRNY